MAAPNSQDLRRMATQIALSYTTHQQGGLEAFPDIFRRTLSALRACAQHSASAQHAQELAPSHRRPGGRRRR